MNVFNAMCRCWLFLLMLMGVLNNAWSDDSSLQISTGSLTVNVGKTAAVNVTKPSGTVLVTSAKTSIATVKYASGVATVKGIAAGSTAVTIKDNKTSKKVAVTVTVPVLTVNPVALNVTKGSSATIAITNASGTVSAKSNATTIATVSYTNTAVVVKGVAAGTAVITIKDSKTSRTVNVTVTAAPVTTLTVSPANISLTVGASSPITVSSASGNVLASSSNPAIAKVAFANGVATVTGVAAGSATISISDSKTTKTVQVSVLSNPVPPTAKGSYTLLAWNDLGMHCMDGLDFSVFTILPPYNTLHAQLKDKAGKLVSSGVNLTYEAIADSTGSINTSSYTKTNFWDWTHQLFGLQPDKDIGLNLDGLASGKPAAGNETPSLAPALMTYNAEYKWFEAEGIPITPFDDAGNKNFYPTINVVAKDPAGNVLATTKTVLPVSDEMTCKACHASNTSANVAQNAAKPAAGWVNDANLEKDWKKNILRLHDEKQANDPLYQSALIKVGYNTKGLKATADSGKPVLCVACHSSNAYFDKQNKTTVMGGVTGIKPFTQVLHDKHATVKDPATQLALDSNGDRSACYLCHPGSKTQCLRGAMGKAVDSSGNSLMSCQSCHGNMKAVASPARQGWFNEPTCESCHNNTANNKRATSGVDANGVATVPSDHTFATNANTPVTGLNLYRFSTGHGGLQCEACHGSTHAEYPSAHDDENDQSRAIQGHAGVVAECTACHTTIPTTVNGGPHGMHTTGNAWVSAHENANKNGTATTPSCAYCHGTTSAGTPLSAIKVPKTINAGEFGTKNWPAGYQVSCYSCHNGPNPD